MGAIKQLFIEWMEDQNLSEKDLDKMDNINEEFFEWIRRKDTDGENLLRN
jgi:hypothetical protein